MSSPTAPQCERRFPTKLVVLSVVLISTCLAVTAVFTFVTLLRLRTQYLSNRGREIAAAIDAQARGPGRRNNPEFWQQLLDESYSLYGDDVVACLALVDQSGAELARAGPEAPAGTYVADVPLAVGRGHMAMGPSLDGWRLQVGLRSSVAAFIRNQAYVNLGVSAVAVGFLILLSVYLMRTIRRFLELEKRERAQQHLSALGTMAAGLAHEIRNPLGAMKGLTQLAQEELPPEHAAQTSLKTVVTEAERLERLVSELLDFARPTNVQVQEFDPAGLVSEVAATLQQRLQEKSAVLENSVPSGLVVRSDPDGLRQVLLNVVGNAVDSVPHRGRIVVRGSREARGRVLALDVDDSGAGLGGRDPEQLFQPFTTTKTRGTGLGLAISRRIVEALGGSITLANGPVEGARCSIRLPDLGPAEAAVRTRGSAARGIP